MMHVNSTSSQAISRRAFLALSGLGVAGLLTACGTSSAHTVKPTPTPAVSPTRQVALTEADWSALGRDLQGTLIRPGNPQYAVAHQLFNTRFDNIAPAGVAYCASPADVQACLAFVRRFNLPVTVRSGGHSYAGYSTTSGLMLDVTRMNSVSLDTGTGAATIGGGAHLIDVYAALAQDGVVIPAGSCPTVGIAGLTLGGGVGVLGRKFGLTCDNLLSAQVVLADGTILTCNQNAHSDLFWALQGGGGGNFGVVTSFTFQVHPVQDLSLATLNWPWSFAAAVFDAWQHWGPQAPDELWSNCLLLGNINKQAGPIVRVNAVYVGGSSALNSLLQQLIDQVGTAPTSSYVYTDPLLETMMVEAGCYGETVAACHLPSQNPQGQVARDTSKARSDYITSPLPRQAIDILVNAINSRQSSADLSGGGIGMDAFGGAINRVAADATAFVHRNTLFSIQYTASWNPGDPASVVSANVSWLNETWQAMRSYASGEAYQNYIDPDLPDWPQAYYGANLPRLQQIKATYDPSNLFRFAQSIPPA
ncbi:MAG TPA: FAD-binding oxidoreductase [Ktedonobacteraceae bacterium]|nr:FAD-binding oxidoreductase [Ktedonobacteraceae bacterium]